MEEKSLKMLKKDLLTRHIPFKTDEPDLNMIRATLTTLLKPVYTMLNGKVYSLGVDKIERGVHYRLVMNIDESFCLTDEHRVLLKSQLKNLSKWQLTFDQIKSDNILRIDVYKIQTYKILEQ